MADLKDVLQAIKNKADDLAHLDVVTLTGDISLSGTDVGDEDAALFKKKHLRLGQIYERLIDLNQNVDLKVVAFTRKETDLDVVTFVSATLGEGEKELLAAHQQMVEAAEAGRIAYFRMLRDLLPF